jgi:hypothetical protein
MKQRCRFDVSFVTIHRSPARYVESRSFLRFSCLRTSSAHVPMCRSGARASGRIGNPVTFRNVPNAVTVMACATCHWDSPGKARKPGDPKSEDRPDVIALPRVDSAVGFSRIVGDQTMPKTSELAPAGPFHTAERDAVYKAIFTRRDQCATSFCRSRFPMTSRDGCWRPPTAHRQSA